MSGFGRQIVLTSVIAAVLVIGIGLGIYYALPSLGMSGVTTDITASNYSIQHGNQSVVATYFNTFTGITSTKFTSNTISSSTHTKTTERTTTSSSTTTSPGGVFTYSPSNSAVKILSVEADTGSSGSGNQSISFKVGFENVGSSDIYVVQGGLNATILWGSARTQIVRTPRCMIMEAPIAITPGENASAFTPGCWSGYEHLLLQPGTIEVQLTLSWSTGPFAQSAYVGNEIIITAEFNLS
jgi:hypothetical protein